MLFLAPIFSFSCRCPKTQQYSISTSTSFSKNQPQRYQLRGEDILAFFYQILPTLARGKRNVELGHNASNNSSKFHQCQLLSNASVYPCNTFSLCLFRLWSYKPEEKGTKTDLFRSNSGFSPHRSGMNSSARL